MLTRKTDKGPTTSGEAFPSDRERAALARCFQRAGGCSGGETRVRKLLFAWHNATELGGFDLSDLWSLTEDWREDVLVVIGMIGRGPSGWYADEYGFGPAMQTLIEQYVVPTDSEGDLPDPATVRRR